MPTGPTNKSRALRSWHERMRFIEACGAVGTGGGTLLTAKRWPQPALVPFQSSANTSARPTLSRSPGAGPKRFRAETENHPGGVHDPFRVLPRVCLSRCSFVPQGRKPQPESHAGMHHIGHQVDRKGGTDGRLCKPIANLTVPHGLSGADLAAVDVRCELGHFQKRPGHY